MEQPNKNRNILISPGFVFILAAYLIASICIHWYYRYEGLNANTIGYLTIALEYARGNFSNGINGFFPPLISWLLVPFIKVGLSPMTALRVVNIIAGAVALIGIRSFSYRFNITGNIRTAVMIASLGIILNYTTFLFPDLLVLCFLIYYLNIVFDISYPDDVKNGLACGVLGAISYLSKGYAFPFFITHFLMMNALHYLNRKTELDKKNVLRNMLAGMLVFVIISGAWVALISSKYNYFTFATAGDYMSKLLGPEVKAGYGFNDTQQDDPVYYAGLFNPPYKSALSAWDDPTYVSMSYFPDAVKLTSNPAYLVKRMLKNSRKVVQIIFVKHFSFLSVLIIFGYLLFCFQPLNKLIYRGDILYPFATIALYSAGLTPFVVNIDNVRYFWIDNILLLLMGAQIITLLVCNNFFNKARKNLLIIFFALSFLSVPARDIFQKPERGERIHRLFDNINKYDINGNIASNDIWNDTLLLAYHLKLNNNDIQYYGVPKKDLSNTEILSELNSHDIDYYFVYGEETLFPELKEITSGAIPGFKIYSLIR